jgi:hypothetical protein
LNTHFITGFTIASAAAQDSRMVWPSWQTSLIFRLSPLVEGPEDGQDLLLLDELAGEGDGFFRAGPGVLEHQLDLAAQQAAGAIDLVDQHLQGFGLRRAQVGGRAGHCQDGPDLDGILLRSRQERRRNQDQRHDENAEPPQRPAHGLPLRRIKMSYTY